jgi:hypothetical protein
MTWVIADAGYSILRSLRGTSIRLPRPMRPAYDLKKMLLASSVAYRVRNEQYRSTLRTPDALTWHTLPRHSSTEVDDSAVLEICNSFRDVSRTASCLLGPYKIEGSLQP